MQLSLALYELNEKTLILLASPFYFFSIKNKITPVYMVKMFPSLPSEL